MLSPTFDLQPMSTGDILDRTIRLYRRHFLHTLAIVSLPYILIIPIWALLGGTAWGQSGPAPWQNPVLVAVLVPSILAYLWLYFVSMGALARSVSERFLGGVPTIWTAYSPVLRRSVSLVWAYFLTTLVLVAVLGAGGMVSAVAVFLTQWSPTIIGYVMAAVLGLGAIVAVVMFVRIVFRSILVTQAIVIEDVRGWGAFKRSWTLMRGSSRKAGIIILFSAVVAFVISFLFNFPAGILMALKPGWSTMILRSLLDSVGQILSAPILMIAFTLLYYDTRIRQEAFDLEMMAKNLGVSPGPSRISAPTRPTPPHSTAPARPPMTYGVFKVCPKCGAQVPNIQPTCGKCGTRVPFGLSKR
ncbi:MAG TPA: hypothetical protein VLG48_06735 [Candidatus Methylomirabilis sp.]|nr:hypothetical protein [Candidatus Methylomirabilis sp.]